MNKLSVHLVTWNGAKYIPYLFYSLKKQNFSDWKLVILDNGSSDKTVELIEREVGSGEWTVDVEFIKEKENLGFAGGHNKLWKEGRGKREDEYVLLLNQDMYLMPDALEKMVGFLDGHKDVAAVSPRLMRWDFDQVERGTGNAERGFTNHIDSLGLKVFRNRRVVEMRTGEKWDNVEKVLRCSGAQVLECFGVSGALPMYRRSAIDDVSFSDGNFFDSLYNSYKEDVDLAYRLRIAGYRAYVLLDTVAYHDRSAEGIAKGDGVAIKNKKKQSDWVKYHSYKNHLMTIYKNEYFGNWLLDAILIKWYELKKFVWFLLFDRAVLKGFSEIWKAREEIRAKREEVKNMRKISWRKLRKWWN